MKYWFWLLFILMMPVNVQAKLITEPVEYKDKEALLKGYLAYDDSFQGKRPAILVVHEWKGLNDYTKKRAEQLARLGYVGFAVDMYGKGVVVKDHEEAGKLSGVYRNDRQLMRQRVNAAYEVLKKNPLADAANIAAIGYCFGGTAVLEMARAGINLKGVVSFHGNLETPVPAEPGAVKSKVLIMQGGDDPFAKPEQLVPFQEEMRRAGADWQIVIFGGAVHSFTVPDAGSDPSKGAAYNEQADKRSWKIMKQFFKEIFPVAEPQKETPA